MKGRFFTRVIVVFFMSLSVQAAEIDAAALYHDYCSVCHGDKGDGKSHAMQGLVQDAVIVGENEVVEAREIHDVIRREDFTDLLIPRSV